MFDGLFDGDGPLWVDRRPAVKPASEARLRAMARQIARPMLVDLGEADGFDEMLDAMDRLDPGDRLMLRSLVDQIVIPGLTAAEVTS